MACDFQLTLIRHLPTLANMERRYIGWSDEPIVKSSRVYKQATSTPEMINGSDSLRCQETAALFYPKTPYQGLPIFREMSFGDWELKTYEDLKDDPIYRKWLTDPDLVPPPNGEFLGEMAIRVMEGLKGLRQSHPVVVTHGGPIRYILSQYAPQETGFWSWDVKHGDKWTLRFTSRKNFEEGIRCESLSVERLMENERM